MSMPADIPAHDFVPPAKEFSDFLWVLKKSMQKLFKARALTAMFDVIVALGRNNRDRISYDTLEELLGCSHRTLQYVVSDLADMGLIEVERCSRDRRRRLIRLSPAGFRLLNECSQSMFCELARIAASNPQFQAANPLPLPVRFEQHAAE